MNDWAGGACKQGCLCQRRDARAAASRSEAETAEGKRRGDGLRQDAAATAGVATPAGDRSQVGCLRHDGMPEPRPHAARLRRVGDLRPSTTARLMVTVPGSARPGTSNMTSSMMRSEDGAEGAGAGAALHGLLRHGLEPVFGHAEVHVVHGEELGELLDHGVLRLGEDLDEVVDGEFFQSGDDGEAADELGDEAEGEEVLGLDRCGCLWDWRAARIGLIDLLALLEGLAEADARSCPRRRAMMSSIPTKAPPQMKRIFSVVSTWMYSCCGCFRPPWGGTLQMVPSSILRSACWTPSPGDVAGDADVLGLAPDLVDLIDVDDAASSARLDVVVGGLEEAKDDVLDILAHVAGLGQGGGVGDARRGRPS